MTKGGISECGGSAFLCLIFAWYNKNVKIKKGRTLARKRYTLMKNKRIAIDGG